MHTPSTALLFWVVLGTLCAMAQPARPFPPVRPAIARLLFLAVLVASGFSLAQGVNAVRANRMAAQAAVLAASGRDAEAKQIYQRIVAFAPWDYQSAVTLASYALGHENPNVALELLDQADLWSASRVSWLLRAAALRQTGNRAGAIGVLSSALAALPDLLTARLELARLYRETGQPEQALQAYMKVLASRQDTASARAVKLQASREMLALVKEN